MSEEVPPPPLRLKPRIKSESDGASDLIEPEPTLASVAQPTTVTAEPTRLKLRPKLDAAAQDNVATTTNPPAAPSLLGLKPRLNIAPPTTPTSPAVSVNPAIAPALEKPTPAVSVAPPATLQDPPKFKLKEKASSPAAGSGGAAAITFPPPPASPTANSALPPIIVADTPVGRATAPAFPVISSPLAASPPAVNPSSKTKPPIEEDADTDEASDPGRSSFAKVLLVIAGMVVVAAAFFGYRKLTADSPAETPVAAQQVPARPSTPSTTLNDLAAAPAAAISKAEAVVAAVNANQESAATELLPTEEMPVRPMRKSTPKAVEKPVPTTSTTSLAPGVTATTAANNVEGDATPAFRTWVAQARISGIFQGSPPRALINGKTVAAGQIVDDLLGITFEGIDPTAKLLVFRDATGVSVTRKF